MVITRNEPLSFSQIQKEFGGSDPISLSEYYGNSNFNKEITKIKIQGVSGEIDSSAKIREFEFGGLDNWGVGNRKYGPNHIDISTNLPLSIHENVVLNDWVNGYKEISKFINDNVVYIKEPIHTKEEIYTYHHDGSTNDNTEYIINFTEDTLCDILIVGGGGSGGASVGGGGGSGGIVYQKNITLNGTYNIYVGKGGDSTTANDSNNRNTDCFDNGISSSIKYEGNIYTLNEISYEGKGGGGGGSRIGDPPNNLDGGFDGGSGGGSSLSGGGIFQSAGNSTQGNTFNLYGTNTSGGNNGGITTTGWLASGGGGAGGAGSGENGGIGVEIDITGTNIFYAAGGGAGRISTSDAGIGGSGIGGDGKRNTTSNGTLYIPTRLNGIDGTGSGGGGGGYNYNYAGGPSGDGGGKGGSGIVIIKTIKTIKSTEYDYNTLTYICDGSVDFIQDMICDILVVGGGGGGGHNGGGGGGGDVLYYKDIPIPSGNYKIKVGKGGTGVDGNTGATTSGESSEFFNIIAGGGGRGMAYSFLTVSDGIAEPEIYTNPINGISTISKGGNGGVRITGDSATKGGDGAGGLADYVNSDQRATDGGKGISCDITGKNIGYGGGGGGRDVSNNPLYHGRGLDGGADAFATKPARPHSGGGGASELNSGASGIVIIKYRKNINTYYKTLGKPRSIITDTMSGLIVNLTIITLFKLFDIKVINN